MRRWMPVTRPMARRPHPARLALLAAFAAVGLGLGAVVAGCRGPAPTADPAGPGARPSDAAAAGGEPWTVRSERGTFEVRLLSEPSPVPINALHAWAIDVAGADGRPVAGATIDVSGGMPAQGHAHGLPTRPSVAAGPAEGAYRIEGLRFHMPGPWEVYLDITAPDGRADRAIVRLDLAPRDG